ncbi:unnamed protein product [Cylindrotheca closterium]|uniref:SUN domain-containing protein n=1 Tax=Cylindrotheca closterium TaxID=2856 RepID=A0AAD2GD73_9STRA|nr:unnamed protein product [Cylindrotheca closterium]
MRIKVRTPIILLAIAIPLFASDNENKISESATDAENDVHHDEKKHEPLISVEEIQVTKLESIRAERIETTSANGNLTDSIGESNVNPGRRKTTEEAQIAKEGEIQLEEGLEGDESSSPQKLVNGKHRNDRKVEEGMGEHLMDSSLASKADQTAMQNGTITNNSTETGSSANMKADFNNLKQGNTSETQQLESDSMHTNSKIDDPIDPVDTEKDKGGEVTVLDEDDFKLRGRVAVDYASKSAGALVIEKSGSFKGTSNLLNGDKDKYAIAPCEEKKFVVVSLSEDILVKEIKLANYERFSSTVKEFQVMGSQTMDTWVDLGTYGAAPGNGEQKFELIEPAWARYLKFKFLSHHGVEYYCTYSQIKVHGSTMVQGFHEQWEESEDPAEVVVDENSDFDGASTDETHGRNETLAIANSDEHPAKNERRMIQNRTHPGASEFPSVSELSMPMSLGYILEGRLSSDDDTFKSYRLSDDFLKHLSRASRKALMERRTLVPLEVGTSIRLNQIVPEISSKGGNVQISASKMSIDFKKTLSILFGQTDMGSNDNLSYLLYPVTNGGQPDLRKATDQQKIQPFNSSEEDRLREDKGDNMEIEKKSLDPDVLDDKENDLTTSRDLNTAAGTSSPTPQTPTTQNQIDSSEEYFELDASIAKLLVGLPGADCLTKLDFADFKAKAHRKDHVGPGSSNHVGSMEPIFKKLTDEIKALQINLSTQEQFTKVSVACYQRVLLDLMSENEKTRRQHEVRLSMLEDELYSSEAFAWRLLRSMSSMVSVFYSFMVAWGETLVEFWFEIWSWVVIAFFYTLGSGLKFLTHLWLPTKRFLSSFGPLYPGIIPPLVDHVDNLLQYCEQRWSSAYLPPSSGIALDVMKFATLQFLSAVLVYVIIAHLRANLTGATGMTEMAKIEVPKTTSSLPVISPEKDAKRL